MNSVANLLLLLAEHADLVELLVDAVKRGVGKQTLADAIREAMIATSDAAMGEELERK